MAWLLELGHVHIVENKREIKMKYYKLRTGTNKGMATLKLDDVSVYTVVVRSMGVLRANTYDIEIHMRSGTIFTANMDEAGMIQWESFFVSQTAEATDEEE